MKIEVGESLMLSYLKHVKKCSFYQTNWKISSNWDILPEALDKVNYVYDKIINTSEFSDVFKKSELNQLLKQSEIDVIGLDSTNTIYTIDIAFHEAGLNYGSKIETKNRVFKKLLRSFLTLLAYFPNKKYELIFTSPKVNNATEEIINDFFNVLQRVFSDDNVSFIYYSNNSFENELLLPTIEASKLDSDTNELFIRAVKCLELFDMVKNKIEKTLISNNRMEKLLVSKNSYDNNDSDNFVNIKGIIFPLYKNENEIMQDFIKRTLKMMFNNNLLPENEINNMLDKEYSYKIFGISYPILQNDKRKLVDNKGHSRYWANELFGNKFYVCSQWWKQYEEKYKLLFSKWIIKISKINRE